VVSVPAELHDINTRDDCERLVRAFYGRALTDPTIGFIFTDVAHLDLDFTLIVAHARLDPEIPAAGHGIPGIHNECQKHLFDLRRIAWHARQVLRIVQLDFNSAQLQLMPHQQQATIDHCMDVGGLHVHGRGSR